MIMTATIKINYFLYKIAICIISLAECNEICDMHATIIRSVGNEGFHRDLHSLVEIVTGYTTSLSDCVMLLKENMPSGMYVGRDELEDMGRLGKLYACAEGEISVEAPEKDSTPHAVYVYAKLNCTENLLSASTTLPVHIRYHSPTEYGGYATVRLKSPKLLINCDNDYQCGDLDKRVTAPCFPCSEQTCQWMEVPYKTNAKTINLTVPVGNLLHYGIVVVTTLFVTCGGCMYILFTLPTFWLLDSKGKERRSK